MCNLKFSLVGFFLSFLLTYFRSDLCVVCKSSLRSSMVLSSQYRLSFDCSVLGMSLMDGLHFEIKRDFFQSH